MAKSGGHAKGGRRGRPVRATSTAASRSKSSGTSPGKAPGKSAGSSARKASAARATSVPAEAPLTGTFTLGAIEGATPGKWIDTWKQRMPRAPLDLVPLTLGTQYEALLSGRVDAALVRLPINRDDLHVIPLYEDQPVVVMSIDSALTAADELELADLAGEVHVVTTDAVFTMPVADTVPPAFATLDRTVDGFETIAAGVGFMIVPLSLARLYRRKDLAYRPLRDVAPSPVALAWPVEATTPAVEAFAGIVRGRTARSSRG